MKKKIKPEPALWIADIREWRVLREFPDYEISNDGRLRRATPGSNTKAGAMIRATLSGSKGSYPKYGLTRRDGHRVYRNAHQLVAAEFIGPPPEPGMMVLHRDDNRLNCLHSNLRWGTGVDNIRDAKRNGLWETGKNHSSARRPWDRPRGERHASSKLTETQVKAIMADNRSPSVIARDYGVDSALIPRIQKGLVWKHITNPAYSLMLEEGKRNA